MPEHRSDSQLMRAVSGGNRDDFETLLRRYADDLLTFLVRVTSDYHQAEEVFQDAFLAVWAQRDSYQFPRPFKPWLYKIALNRCREKFRTARLPTDSSSNVSELGDLGSNAAITAVRRETVVLMEHAVQQLPERQRTVVAMRVWSQMSYGEIADAVGLKEATVRSHMHHALVALRNHLRPHSGE